MIRKFEVIIIKPSFNTFRMFGGSWYSHIFHLFYGGLAKMNVIYGFKIVQIKTYFVCCGRCRGRKTYPLSTFRTKLRS